MLNENAKNWVVALRSGDYKQGRGQLYCVNTDSYCCLGIGAKQIDLDFSGNVLDENNEDSYQKVAKYLGFQTIYGGFTRDSQYTELTILNDDGATCLEIADIVESEPEGLFA